MYHEKVKDGGNISTSRIALYYIICNFISKGMIVLTTPIFTRILSETEYGKFTTFTSFENIMAIIVTLDLEASIARAKYDFDDDMNGYLKTILLISNLVTLLIYIFAECNSVLVSNIFSVEMKYIRLLFVYLLFSPAFTFLQIKHRIYKKYRFFVAFSISSSVVRALLSVALVVIFDDKLLGRIIGYIVPITIMNIGLWLYVILKGKRLSVKYIRYAVAISLPLIPHALSNNLLSSSDRIMISNICGSEAVSFYSVAYTASMMASLLWTSMNQAWAPWLFDNMALGSKENIWNKSKIYISIFIIAIIGLLLFSPEIILILGGERYYESRFIMPPIIIGFLFQFVYGMYVNIEIFMKKTITISVGTVLAAFINIGLNWLFIPRIGYLAASYTTMAGYFLLLLFHYLIVKKCGKFADIYDKKFIFSIVFLTTVFGAISIFLYYNNGLRYFIMVLYFTILGTGIIRYIKKEKFQENRH